MTNNIQQPKMIVCMKYQDLEESESNVTAEMADEDDDADDTKGATPDETQESQTSSETSE